VSARTLVKGLLVAGLLLLIVSLMMRSRLPDQGRLSPELLREPEQTAVQEAPIKRTVGGVDYTIKPLYAYDLTGLVVSRHDSDTWWDYIHREWNDHLNVVDLCVVWGDNVANGSYRKQSFSSGQFVCYWQAPSAEAFAAFNPYKISNNHIITDDHRLAKKFRTVRVGDQGRFAASSPNTLIAIRVSPSTAAPARRASTPATAPAKRFTSPTSTFSTAAADSGTRWSGWHGP
jgi:hypothetical protein